MAVAPHPSTSRDAVDGMAAMMVVQEAEARAVLQSRLNNEHVSRVIAFIHSEAPNHYTLLVRSRIGPNQYELKYFDSLRKHSANGMVKAQTFADQCGWEAQVQPPVNRRFQDPSDGWSCGLWCLQFAEETVRQCRLEPVVVPVVKISDILARVNRFIQTVAAERPEPVAAALAAVLESLAKGSEVAKTMPVPCGSVVDLTVATPSSVPPPVEPEAPVQAAKKASVSSESMKSALAAVLASLDASGPSSGTSSASPAPLTSSAGTGPPASSASAGPPASAISASGVSSGSAAPPTSSASAGPPASAISASGASLGSAAPPTSSASSASGEYTFEMAVAAKSRCSKCRMQGCAQCLKQYHIPRSLIRQWSRESGGSDGPAL